ncbi:hydroxyproline dehydrogenase-like isoform X2 [Limulus polyphemus]|uniref:Proline dehydrogenase n=1 Tax=Limulus polyphemus TaxID=6850 RepID=A0ABM1B445_LIMPO|nr:hydroxyproline dehydrogenase-like isoform X2 [Limulus polyphemus]
MSLNTSKPMLQLKLTALLSTDLLVNIGNLFAGSRDQVRLVEDISRCLQGTCSEVLEFKILNPEARLELQVLMERLRQIGQTARDKGVRILVDAEHTYENLGLSLLTLAMMAAYNSTTSIVWNTYQCYLKKTMDNVKNEMSIARRLNVYFGIKLVRGAYVSQERDEAKRIGLPDPVCENYKTTNDNYNRVLSFLLDTASRPGAKINIMVATHNEESTKLAVTRIREYKLDRLQDTVVTFGHLLGMCDHISVILAQAGYQVYKALPYGPVEMVMPYLARRAAENKTGLMGARREQQLLWEELKRRLWRQCSCCACFPY